MRAVRAEEDISQAGRGVLERMECTGHENRRYWKGGRRTGTHELKKGRGWSKNMTANETARTRCAQKRRAKPTSLYTVN